MSWLQALILGLIQGLTEFLPVSSSGHLMIAKELLGVDGEGFLDFTVTVHMATVLSTVIVFRKPTGKLLAGFFRFRYNDETDYVFKIIVSMIPVAIVGLLFKDQVESLFSDTLTTVAICLLVTAVLLLLSDYAWKLHAGAEHAGMMTGRSAIGTSVSQGRAQRTVSVGTPSGGPRNGINYWQAFVVGIGQACAVAPGLSRSGTTIATGLLCGVQRKVMAQFSFLMVLVPIIGEQMLDVLKGITGEVSAVGGPSPACLVAGFLSAFLAGLFACKAMVAIVRKAKLSWFALYCAVVAVLIFVIA